MKTVTIRPPAELAELNESDLKKVTASAYLEIDVECPHCKEHFDCLDDDSIKEVFGPNLRAEGIEVELECPHCKKPFLVTEITY